jgi:SM-20-related protein
MRRERFFAKLGVLIVSDFLEPGECARLCGEMRAAPRADALLSLRGRADEVVDPGRRKSAAAQVSATTRAAMVERLLAIKPRVEGFFGMALAGVVEAPKFLIYQTGDFFVPHRDVVPAEEGTSSPIIPARRINLVVCLNGESETAGMPGYGGAALTLYGLIDTPPWRQYGLAVPGVAGSLVAFRADVLHEVAPIARGERYNIVSRMLDPSYRANDAA